jgi:hypothetical protein
MAIGVDEFYRKVEILYPRNSAASLMVKSFSEAVAEALLSLISANTDISCLTVKSPTFWSRSAILITLRLEHKRVALVSCWAKKVPETLRRKLGLAFRGI